MARIFSIDKKRAAAKAAAAAVFLCLCQSLWARTPVIMDTDTYNEVDDQIAVSYMLRSRDIFDVRGITAAPFRNWRASSSGEGTAKSFAEALRVKRLAGASDVPVLMGAKRTMRDKNDPVGSDASAFIILEAKRCAARGEKLRILSLGAITNVASALLIEPRLADMIEVVWLGGSLEDPIDFNFVNDTAAAEAVFDSDVPFIQIPTNTSSRLSVTVAELSERMKNGGPLCDYLSGTVEETRSESRIIWDIAAVALFTTPDSVRCETIERPGIADGNYIQPGNGRVMKRMMYLDRDKIFDDLFKRVGEQKI